MSDLREQLVGAVLRDRYVRWGYDKTITYEEFAAGDHDANLGRDVDAILGVLASWLRSDEARQIVADTLDRWDGPTAVDQVTARLADSLEGRP